MLANERPDALGGDTENAQPCHGRHDATLDLHGRADLRLTLSSPYWLGQITGAKCSGVKPGHHR